MVRILQIMKAMSRDGLETFVMNTYQNIDKSKVQFDFLVFVEEKAAYDKVILQMGGRIFHLPARNKGYFRYLKALDNFFSKNNNYIAVHLHADCLGNLEPLYFAKKHGIRIRTLHSHNSAVNGRIITKILHYVNKLFYHHVANRYCACSQKAAIWLYGRQYKKKNVHIIHNGININLFKFNTERRRTIRKELGISDNQIVVGHVGRFTHVKNHPYLIEIADQLKELNVFYKMILLGTGEEEGKIANLIRNKNLEEYVIMAGSVSNTYDFYWAMDVFVLPSFFEGLPVVMVEAQAAGLPCLISDTISADVVLTRNVVFKSIEVDPNDWCNDIISLAKKKRIDTSEDIVKAGYSSKCVADEILRIDGVQL